MKLEAENSNISQPDIAQIAALIGDSARASMLIALMGGKALTATELAIEAEITSQTASSHLTKLVNNGLLVVQKQGRHKYFQLKSKQVADLLEALLNISSEMVHSKIFTGPRNPDLRKARICYDHLAGEMGVLLYESLIKKQLINIENNVLQMTEPGLNFFLKQGVNFDELNGTKRPLCKSCLDWSERHYHLAGSLGKWVLNDLFKKNWAKKDLDSRVIRFSSVGLKHFFERYGIENH